MRIGRTMLAGAAGLAVMAVFAPAAWADVTVTQTDTPDPVDQGGTVTLQTTITNTGGNIPDLRAHVRITRPGSQTPVDDTYLSFSTSQGNCGAPVGGSSAECVFGPVAPGASVTLNATVTANESFAQTVSAFTCIAPPQCDFENPVGSGGSTTQVDYPTAFKGSSKVKMKGVPAECTNSAFKLKAKSKKANRMFAYLKGPFSEFGTPLPVSGVSGRIKKTQGSKLKVKVKADTLDPGFYELKVSAKRKGKGAVSRTATFQVCGPNFGFPA
jgi:hypothetical protein